MTCVFNLDKSLINVALLHSLPMPCEESTHTTISVKYSCDLAMNFDVNDLGWLSNAEVSKILLLHSNLATNIAQVSPRCKDDEEIWRTVVLYSDSDCKFDNDYRFRSERQSRPRVQENCLTNIEICFALKTLNYLNTRFEIKMYDSNFPCTQGPNSYVKYNFRQVFNVYYLSFLPQKGDTQRFTLIELEFSDLSTKQVGVFNLENLGYSISGILYSLVILYVGLL